MQRLVQDPRAEIAAAAAATVKAWREARTFNLDGACAAGRFTSTPHIIWSLVQMCVSGVCRLSLGDMWQLLLLHLPAAAVRIR